MKYRVFYELIERTNDDITADNEKDAISAVIRRYGKDIYKILGVEKLQIDELALKRKQKECNHSSFKVYKADIGWGLECENCGYIQRYQNERAAIIAKMSFENRT